MRPDLRLLATPLAVCRLPAAADLPPGLLDRAPVSVTRTAAELSITCPEDAAPAGARVEPGWRALEVSGPLDFALVGILAAIAAPLAEAGVSLFAISTFDTDYVLVKAEALETAVAALEAAGFAVIRGS